MTERLRDVEAQEAADPTVELAARIVRGVAPFEPSASRKQRVWRWLSTEQQPGRAWKRRRPRAPLVSVAILVGTGAVALALGEHYRSKRPVPEAPAAASAKPPAHFGRSQNVGPETHLTLPPVVVIVSLPPPRPEETTAGAPAANQANQARIVYAAMQALRQEHDPARAVTLLDGYRSSYPNGALAEEALALEIEAEGARSGGAGDARAASLADQYLARYPNGRFALAAKAARERYGR